METPEGIFHASILLNSRRIALVDSSTAIETSYWELGKLAAGVEELRKARHAKTLCIILRKSELFYASVVSGILFGKPFLILDTDTPERRILEIVSKFPDPIIIHDASLDSELIGHNLKLATIKDVPKATLPLQVSAADGDPSYYVCTSGSTGEPKIVEGRHSALKAFSDWASSYYEVDSNTRWAQYSSVGFDLTLADIVTVLPFGGYLVSISTDFDRLRPSLVIEKHQITHWHSVPSVIPFLVSESAKEVSDSPITFSFGGEPLFREEVEKLWRAYPQAKIFNIYGPTEGTIIFMSHEVTPEDLHYDAMPLGKPIQGWDILLRPVDEYNEFEATVVSPYIAKGYLGDDQGDFGSVTGNGSNVPTFGTGDILKLQNGQLFFSSRLDGLVKIRGVRIEVGEVEASAREVGAANPVAFVDGSYLHLAFEASIELADGKKLKALLADILPRSRQPSIYSCVDRLPRSTNGKIDRQATALKLRRYPDEDV